MSKVEKIFLRPVSQDIKVPGENRWLNRDGEWVRKSQYWLRRIKDGDVVKGPFDVEEPELAKKAIKKQKEETN